MHAWGRRERPADDAVLEIGSITKAFTGVLLADMHLRGELSLGDPLSRHLPDARPPRWAGAEPTLEELATHRTGLPNAPRGLAARELAFVAGLRRTDPWAGLGPGEYAALVERTRARRPRTGRIRYSSLGFGLLGDALAATAGRPWHELVVERVCLPLGMADTGVAAPADRLLRGRTRRGRPAPALEDLMPAAGSLRSTVPDLLRLLKAAADPSAEPPGPALAMAAAPRARAGRRMAIGLGWLVLDAPRRPRIVWHNGGTWGYRSFAAFLPQTGAAAVVLANTARSVDRLGFALLEG